MALAPDPLQEPHPGGDFFWTPTDNLAWLAAVKAATDVPLSPVEAEDRQYAGELVDPSRDFLEGLARAYAGAGGEPVSGRHYLVSLRTIQKTPSEPLSDDSEPEPTGLQMGSIRRYLEDPWPLIRSALACLSAAATIECLDLDTGEHTLRRFRCRSWRCPWCGPAEARMLFARLTAALTASQSAAPWYFLTLTFDPKAGNGIRSAYKLGCRATQNLRDAIRYDLTPGYQRGQLEYVAVWERHRSGWPHQHMILRGPRLDDRVQSAGIVGKYRNRVGEDRPRFRWVEEFLRPVAVRSGFGPILQLEKADGPGALASYFSKLASEMAGTKAYQQPTNAPKGFRRVRPSRGLLPPRWKPAGNRTGVIHFRPLAHVRAALADNRRGIRVAPWQE